MTRFIPRASATRLLHAVPVIVLALLASGCVSLNPRHAFIHGKEMNVHNSLYSRCEPGMDARTLPSGNGGALDPESISLLNWNIYKGQRNNWANDLQSFIGSRDIITIQEAHLSEQLKAVLAHHDYQWTLNAAFHLKELPSGVMTASRVPAVDTCGLRHREPLIRTAKTALVTYFPIRGHAETLLVANIHGINFTLGTFAYRTQIRHLFEMIHEHNGPVIIAGDFNTWNQTRMTIVEQHALEAGLKTLDYESHNRTHFLGNALDHVFYRGLEPRAHHSWHVRSSDHNPTRVHFHLL